MAAKCARRGCSKPLPKTALLHGDPYCSTVCCRMVHGLDPAASDREAGRYRKCKGCRGPIDEFDPGCRFCQQRRRARERAGTLAA